MIEAISIIFLWFLSKCPKVDFLYTITFLNYRCYNIFINIKIDSVEGKNEKNVIQL